MDTQFHNMLGCQHVIGLQYFTHGSTMDPWLKKKKDLVYQAQVDTSLL